MKNGTLINNTNSTNSLEWHYIRSPRRKNTVIAVLVILICTLFAALLYLLLSKKVQECTTATCVRSSMEIFHYINPKAKPCDDFYLFSCGNFLRNTNPDNPATRSVSDTVENEIQSRIKSLLEAPIDPDEEISFSKAKKFYNSCMNTTAIEWAGLRGIKNVFRVMGGWPTLEGSRWKTKFTWENALIALRGIGVKPDAFFKVDLDKDLDDDKKYVLVIRALPYSPSEISDDAKRMYLDYMGNVTVLFGANPDVARRDSEEIIDFLLKLARIYEESVALNQTGLHDVHTLSELQYKYKQVPWKYFLNGILEPAEFIWDDDVVVVDEPLYLLRLTNILTDAPKRLLANFIAWHSLQQLINYLPAKVLDRAYEYLGKVNGKITREPRWETCIKATQERMDSVVSAAYINNFFNPESRDDIEELMLNIKVQFRMNLRRWSWLDDNSKDLIVPHLLKSYQDIGSYGDLLELQSQNKVYERVDIAEDNLLESVLKLDFLNLNLEYGKLRMPVRENWLAKTDFVTGIQVHYLPKDNILKFPVAIFGGVYYQLDRPKYLNYGALGSIVAHEMSHVFVQARDGDSHGDLRSLWSMESLMRYGQQVQCLSEQYGSLHIKELNRQLDSQRTADEDVADLAGVKIAYDAYANWVDNNGEEPILPGLSYSPNQLFWISSAIRHCAKYSPQILEMYVANSEWSPPQFRVNGPLQNLKEFADDFGCPVGSNMNPKKKCSIW